MPGTERYSDDSQSLIAAALSSGIDTPEKGTKAHRCIDESLMDHACPLCDWERYSKNIAPSTSDDQKKLRPIQVPGAWAICHGTDVPMDFLRWLGHMTGMVG